jgi:hypothetical protein
LHTDRNESGEGAGAAEIDQSQKHLYNGH